VSRLIHISSRITLIDNGELEVRELGYLQTISNLSVVHIGDNMRSLGGKGALGHQLEFWPAISF
jgi:hypothetical protein